MLGGGNMQGEQNMVKSETDSISIRKSKTRQGRAIRKKSNLTCYMTSMAFYSVQCNLLWLREELG